MKKLSVLILMILFRISYQYSYSFRTQSRLLATKKSVEQSCSVKSQEKHEIPYKLKEFSLLDVYGNDVSCSHNVSEKAFDGINMLSFSLIGDPQSLMRHRVSRSGFSYNPSLPKQSQFSQACSKFLPMSPVDFPLDVELNFFFQRPKSHYISVKKERILKDNREKWCLKRQGLAINFSF